MCRRNHCPNNDSYFVYYSRLLQLREESRWYLLRLLIPRINHECGADLVACGILDLAFLAALVLGFVGNAHYSQKNLQDFK